MLWTVLCAICFEILCSVCRADICDLITYKNSFPFHILGAFSLWHIFLVLFYSLLFLMMPEMVLAEFNLKHSNTFFVVSLKKKFPTFLDIMNRTSKPVHMIWYLKKKEENHHGNEKTFFFCCCERPKQIYLFN